MTHKLTNEEENKVLGISTAVGITIGVLTAAAFIALVVMFPPVAALGLGAVLMYGTTLVSTTALFVFLAHALGGKLYTADYSGIRDPGRSGRSMRASYYSAVQAREDAESGKSMLQNCCAFLAVMVVPVALFAAIMSAPFAITILVATVITGLTIGGGFGSIAGVIAAAVGINHYEKKSSGDTANFSGSTARSNKSLGINGIQTRTTFKSVMEAVNDSAQSASDQLPAQGAASSLDSGAKTNQFKR